MERNPPHIKKAIRECDGFVCAHPDCFSPYLTYHHFDPPWHVKNHNNPNGIIALCGTHHNLADGGTFTNTQLRDFKDKSSKNYLSVKEKIQWMRNKMLLITGGHVYMDNTYDFIINDKPFIWFNRDKDGYALLNLSIEDEQSRPIIKIVDNDFEITSAVQDIECYPSGKRITIKISDVDYISINFKDFETEAAFAKVYPNISIQSLLRFTTFPFSTVNISGSLYKGKLNLGQSLRINDSKLEGGFVIGNMIGFFLKF